MIEILVFLAALFAAAPAWADDAGSEPLKAVGGFVVIVLALICVAYLGRLASRIGRAVREGPRALVGLEKLVIGAFQNGVLYRNGSFARVLTPGTHWINPKVFRVAIVEMRPEVLQTTQGVTTSDRIRVLLRSSARVQIRDPRAAVESARNHQAELQAQLQSAIRKVAIEWTFRDLHQRQKEFNAAVHETVNAQILHAGAECIDFELLDAESSRELPDDEPREIGFQAP